ncbi:hypothetical protein HG263_12510 [Pseudoalteromonas sp. JBTF-M23]|uniref:OmpR/PhoB-type domain-containing protein n=1 Tax=Pseudoalteromonas caenipelagi TaxID=2726988 RepID=A0A849VHZ7_9GAMM|nr:winged helix-turn-helix domain-containing protein [Pseudoalteromonas caenipelagi]NOU51351.1 hypothetical protein [Pseudoalteromonas caenipelagi]
MAYIFETYTFDPELGVLYSEEEEIQLRPKLAQLLEYFLQNSGRVITRDELLSALWVNGEYRESSLTQSIRELRKQLKDNVQNPIFIKTYPQRGYVWISAPKALHGSSDDNALSTSKINKHTLSDWLKKPMVIILCALSLVFFSGGVTFLVSKNNFIADSKYENNHNDRLLIAPFKNLTGETEFDWLNYGLRHLLIQNLKDSGVFTVIPDKPAYHLFSQEHEAHENMGETLEALVQQGHADRWLEASVSQENGLFVFHYTLSDKTGKAKKGVIYSDDLTHPLADLAATLAKQIIGKNGIVSTYQVSDNDFSTKDYLEGLYALETRGVGLAMRYFEASVLHDPNNLHSQVELARTYWHTGRLAQANEIFNQLNRDSKLEAHSMLKARMLEYWGELKLAQGDYETANSLLEQALMGVDEIDNDVLRSKIYNKLSAIAWLQQDKLRSEHFALQAKRLFDMHDMTESEAQRLYYIGNPPAARPDKEQPLDLEASLQSLYKSVRYYTANGNLSLLMKTYFALGQNYLAPLDDRLNALMSALDLAAEQQEVVYQIKIANYLGFYFIQLHEGDKALQYINLAADVLKHELDIAPLRYYNQLLLAMAKMDIGIATDDVQALESAKRTFTRLLAQLSGVDNFANIKADAYLLKGWSLLALAQYQGALESLTQANRLYEDLKMKDSQSYAVYSLIYTHLQLGNDKQAIALSESGKFNKKLIYDYAAFAYFRAKDIDNAIAQLKKTKRHFAPYWREQDESILTQLLSRQAQIKPQKWLEALQKPYSVYCESEWNLQSGLK